MIVITAPTGAIGRQVLAKVLDGDEPVRVIARDPARLPVRTRERVEVVPGSHGDIEVVGKAFAGADAVFWLLPLDPRTADVGATFLDFTRPACEAIVGQGVARVVGVSAVGRGFGGSAGLVTASLAMDDLIAETGVSYRALTMPAFMENLLGQVDAIREQGMFFSPIAGDRRMPTVATRDIAAAAADLLLDRSWTGQSSVPLLGAEDLSFDETAEIMSDVLGKPVRYRQITAGAFLAAMTGSGMSDAVAQSMVDMLLAKNDGMDNIEPRTPCSTTPTTFHTWCAEVLKPAVLA
jgi:uncharacterized protein YbjT (DUF2867 family)